MEIRPDRWNETQFLPSSSRVDTAVWMHHLDANKTAGEEARRQLHKNVASNIKQVLAATPPQSTNYTATCLPSRKLSKLDEPGTQDTAGDAETSSKVMYSYGPPHMAELKQDDQLEHTYGSCVRIWDEAQKTCQRWWTVGRSGERGLGISMLAARHDDDDDDVVYVLIYPSEREGCNTSRG